MSLLATAGFDLYSDNPSNLTAQLSTFTSPLLSPTQDDTSVSLLDLNSVVLPSSSMRVVDTGGGAVFTRSRSSTDATTSSSSSHKSSILQMSSPHDFSPSPISSPISPITLAAPALASDEAKTDTDDVSMRTPAPDSALRPMISRSQSHSPSSCEVSVLAPDLTYVGLSDEHAETWGLKIVKLVAYPDLISGVASSHSRSSSASAESSLPPSPLEAEVVDISKIIAGAVRRMEQGTGSGSDTTTRVGAGSDKGDGELATYEHEDQSMPWDEDPSGDADTSDDEYLSPTQQTEDLAEETGARPTLPHNDTADTVHPSQRSTQGRARSVSSSSSSSSSAASLRSPIVPFFSFTRTSEGSSLTAPVSLLAALFPPHERDMVICSDELDILDSRQASPAGDDEDARDEDSAAPQGPLRCLQIDLRKFGLGEFRSTVGLWVKH